MKFPASPRILFFLGFVLLATTNIIVLAGVFSNRSGNPEAQLTLTERELQIPYMLQKENSGLTLHVSWRVPNKENNRYDRKPNWLNAGKLKELGFTIDTSLKAKVKRNSYRYPLPKEVFIVLEYNGESYIEALRQAEAAFANKEGLYKTNIGDKKLHDAFLRAEKKLKQERINRSRLFAIDAGLDPQRLREEYTDRTRFIITRGLVRPSYSYGKKTAEMTGYIEKLNVESIHVPINLRKIFNPILLRDKLRRDAGQPPRYKVNLAYGARLEPWILSVQGME